MKNVIELLKSQPAHTSVHTFLANAPTMTNSRVEALATGTQPPYIKIAKGFGSDHIMDDNIILQINKAGYKLQAVGDSLWTSMYPREYYSFVDTRSSYSQEALDYYVMRTMKQKLEETDWNFLITHVNEMDHRSHEGGFVYEPTLQILRENDNLIGDYTKRLNNETLIVTFGDHGARPENGFHGGGSKIEIEAGLFSYTKKQRNFLAFQFSDELAPQTRKLIQKTESGSAKGLTEFLNRKVFSQYDISVTTAAIFNAPIPFRSIGSIIPELLHYDVKKESFISESLYEFVMDMSINYLQVAQYYKIAYERSGEMKKQLDLMENGENYLKQYLPKIILLLQKAIKIEENYFNSGENNEMNSLEFSEYENAIKETYDFLKKMRVDLESQQKDFASTWCEVKKFYMYTSWLTRILISISLAFSAFLLGYIIQQGKYNLLTDLSSFGIIMIIQVILLVIVALFQSLDYITVSLVMIGFGTMIYLQIKLILSELSSIKDFYSQTPMVSVIFAIMLLIFHSLGCTMETITAPGIFFINTQKKNGMKASRLILQHLDYRF